MNSRTINNMKVGDSASFTKTVTEADVVNFAGVTGDFNPAHVNDTIAKNSMFKGRIAHGMLSAGFISTVIGTDLPGAGTIYLGQNLKFVKPVYIGDTVTATVTVKGINEEKNRAELETNCVNQNGEAVIIGSANVMPPRA